MSKQTNKIHDNGICWGQKTETVMICTKIDEYKMHLTQFKNNKTFSNKIKKKEKQQYNGKSKINKSTQKQIIYVEFVNCI